MSLSYDVFTSAFLMKVTSYDLIEMCEDMAQDLIDNYMKRAIANFKFVCAYDLTGAADDDEREFAIDVDGRDVDELADIVSDGMIVQWLKPFVYRQENLENVLNTRDFTTYSPAELLRRVGEAYKNAQRDYTNEVREYSYNHGDLTELHL